MLMSAFTFGVAMSTTNTSVGKIGVLNSEIKMLIPEGWGFFTRNPQEDITEIYQIEGSTLNTVIFRGSDYHNLFGVNRKYRRLEAEKEVVLSQILPNKWKFDKPQLPLTMNIDTMVTVRSKSIRNLQGRYLICKSKRVPWAWTNLHSNLYGLVKYAVVNVIPVSSR